MLTSSSLSKSTKQARCLATADVIEANASAFDMRAWCYCIAGMAVLHETRQVADGHVSIKAREYLGLNHADASTLFSPHPDEIGFAANEPNHLGRVNAKWAAAVLRYYAMTGKADWIAAKDSLRPAFPPLANGERHAEPGARRRRSRALVEAD